MYLQPYTFYSIVILLTVVLAIAFGYLMGTIVSERRSLQSKRKPVSFRF